MKKIKHKIINKSILWMVLCITIISLVFVTANGIRQIMNIDENTISIFVSALEMIGLMITAVIAVYQLNESQEIARATFISELNKSYVENPEYVSLYNYLQKCFDGECPHKNECILDGKCRMGDPQPQGGGFLKSTVSNYLTFFETIYLLNERGVLGLDVIDDLFAYRFFLAVHSKFFQQEKLIAQPENFINIFCLEKEWIEYRKRNNKDTDPSVRTVFNQMLLKDGITEKYGSQRYQELITFNKKEK